MAKKMVCRVCKENEHYEGTKMCRKCFRRNCMTDRGKRIKTPPSDDVI